MKVIPERIIFVSRGITVQRCTEKHISRAINILREDLTFRIAINIFQRQSFYFPPPYNIALSDTKLTFPLNMELESLRPFAYCNYGIESRRRYGSLLLHSDFCCQVAVSVTSRSLVERSPMRCGVSVFLNGCRRGTSWRKP